MSELEPNQTGKGQETLENKLRKLFETQHVLRDVRQSAKK